MSRPSSLPRYDPTHSYAWNYAHAPDVIPHAQRARCGRVGLLWPEGGFAARHLGRAVAERKMVSVLREPWIRCGDVQDRAEPTT